MRISVTQSGRRSVLVVLVCLISVIGSPFAASSVALSVPAFPCLLYTSHTSFEELTPTLLREFVEKIVVHECSYDENKTRRQDIEIYYSFVGKVDLPE